jgi:hypothetical protein
VHYDSKDLKNTLNIAKGIEFSTKDEQIVIFKDGKKITLSNKQLYGLLKKLQWYLELDERCIDRDGPQFKVETKKLQS